MTRALYLSLVVTAIACSHNALPNHGPEATVDLATIGGAPTSDLAEPRATTSCTHPEVARPYGPCNADPHTICIVDDPTAFVPTLLECVCQPSPVAGADGQWYCTPNGCQLSTTTTCAATPPRADQPCASDFECTYCCGGGTATTRCSCRAGQLPVCAVVASCGG
jgi:hypothetical protein